MRALLAMGCCLVIAGSARVAHAGQPYPICHVVGGKYCGVCDTWCPDDYCRKRLPGPPPCPGRGCADDYCRKPLPAAPRPACGCVDDYCRKPVPCPPRNCEPWYRCVPMRPAGNCPIPAAEATAQRP